MDIYIRMVDIITWDKKKEQEHCTKKQERISR